MPCPYSATPTLNTDVHAHGSWFDVNNDGVVDARDFSIRLRQFGYAKLGADIAAFLGAHGISEQTGSKKGEIRLDTVAQGQGKGEASSWIFDDTGNFDASRFDEFVREWSVDGRYFTETNLTRFVLSQDAGRGPKFRAHLQFTLLLDCAGEIMIATDKQKKISVESFRRLYTDGDYLASIAQRYTDLTAGQATPASAFYPAGVDAAASDARLLATKSGVWTLLRGIHKTLFTSAPKSG